MAQAVKPGILEERTHWRPPNRGAIGALVAAALAIGVLPYALFLEPWKFQLPLAVAIPAAAALVGLGTSLVALRARMSVYTETPNILEYGLAGWSSLAAGSFISLVGIGFYWFARGLVWIVVWVAGWFDATLQPDWEFWGALVSVALVAWVLLVVTLELAPDLAGKLFPNTAGVRSAYYSLLVEHRRVSRAAVATAVALIALIALAVLWPPPGRKFAVGLTFLLFYSGLAIGSMSRSAPRVSDKKRILQALKRILEAIGYEIVPSPRTGNAAIDPLITTVDLLAHSPEKALVVEVKAPIEGRSVEWHEAAALRNAARKLHKVLWESDSAVEVLPVLVLAGRPRADSLRLYLEDEAMDVIEPEGSDWIEQAQPEAEPEALEAVAEFLGLEPVDPYPLEPERATLEPESTTEAL